MPGVPAILLDQVAEKPAQSWHDDRRGRIGARAGRLAIGQRRVERRAGPFDGGVPQRVELFGRVVGGRGELPIVIVVPVGEVPRALIGSPVSLTVA